MPDRANARGGKLHPGDLPLTGVAKGTVLKLLEDIGKVCAQYQDDHLVNLDTRRVECDEIWSFVGAKQKNVPEARKDEGPGDIWTWTAIDATSP